MPDHVHILLSIPPKCVVSDVVGFPKGKSAIHIARTYVGRRRNFTGQHFWAWGYDVSTVGRAEATIRAYIQRQEGAVNTLLKFPFSTLANGQRPTDSVCRLGTIQEANMPISCGGM